MLQCYKNKRRAFSPSPKMPTIGTLLLHIFISQHSPWMLQNNKMVAIDSVRWISHLSPFLALECLALWHMAPCWNFLPQIEDCFCDQKMIPIDRALLSGAPDSLAGSLTTSNLIGRHFSLPSFLGLLLCPRPKSWSIFESESHQPEASWEPSIPLLLVFVWPSICPGAPSPPFLTLSQHA